MMNDKPAKALCSSTAAAAALLMIVTTVGCNSRPKQPAGRHDVPSEAVSNRLMVREAFAEHVYAGVAAERAIYPRDFNPGTSLLNELGTQRVQMLVEACRGASERVTVVRGEESDQLYDARVAAARQHLTDAGVDMNKITVAKGGHVGGVERASSERAIMSFERMMADYAPQPGGAKPKPPADAPAASNQTKKGQ